MAQTSLSISFYRKPQDAVVYTVVPEDNILPEGSEGTNLRVGKIVGSNTIMLTPEQITSEGIELRGEADATDCVHWDSGNLQFYVSTGVVYGKIYTISAFDRNGSKLATTTIGVTARGTNGQDGTSIDIKGSAVKYFANIEEYRDTTKATGDYLVGEKSVYDPGHGASIHKGAYIYSYNAADNTTTAVTDAVKGDTYLLEDDGHLYVATIRKGQMLVLGNNLEWFDAGEIRGRDAVTISVEGENVILPHNGAPQYVYVDVYRGAKKLVYGEDYTCSFLGSTDKGWYVLDGKVGWTFDVRNERFFYRLGVVRDYRGTNITGTIPYTITIEGVEYHRNINVRTLLNGIDGTNGFNGCLIRRSEWEEGKEYRNDSDYNAFDPLTEQYIIDEVTVSDETSGEDYAYLVTAAHRGKISGNEDEAGNIIKPGVPTQSGSWNYDADNSYYTRLQNEAPIRVPFADIKQAIVEYLQARQIVITDDNSNPYGAFGGGNEYPLWFGGENPEHAVTRINRQGHLFSQRLVTMGNEAHVEVEDGLMKVFGIDQQYPNIVFGVDDNGFAVLKYYQGDMLLYNLGPQGIMSEITETENRFTRGLSFRWLCDARPTNTIALRWAEIDTNVQYYRFIEGFKKAGTVYRFKISTGATTVDADYTTPYQYNNGYFSSNAMISYSNYYDGNYHFFDNLNGKPDESYLMMRGYYLRHHDPVIFDNCYASEVWLLDEYAQISDSFIIYFKKINNIYLLCDHQYKELDSPPTIAEYRIITNQPRPLDPDIPPIPPTDDTN